MLRPRRVHLLPPVSYQGGKRRQAPEIVRHMALDPEQEFFDLCCGSGAVSLELISRGHNPAKITMVDAGPWGDVWRLVGAGEFDLKRLSFYLERVPEQREKVADFARALRDIRGPSHPDAPYVFLVLQGASFGGKAVGVRPCGERWLVHSFMRRDEDDTMAGFFPNPREMLRRMHVIVQRCKGITGIRALATPSLLEVSSPQVVVYVDPPYKGTSGYGEDFDVAAFAASVRLPIFASELRPLSDRHRKLRRRVVSTINALSGTSPDRSEYLSLFNADWPTPDTERAEQMGLF